MTASGPDAFAYDLAERMSSATLGSVTTDYTYDGEGTRLSADDGTEVTEYLWDTLQPLPLLALETDGTDILRRYLYGHALVSMEDAAGTWYVHPDHLGSTAALTDAAGDVQWEHAYEPYGADRVTNQVEPGAPEAPMRFTGQYLDPTGLYHLRARQYAPALGVFTATDPLSRRLDQAMVSPYAYVGGRPTFGVDPSGLICFSCPVKTDVNAIDDAWDATGGKVVNFVSRPPLTGHGSGRLAPPPTPTTPPTSSPPHRASTATRPSPTTTGAT
jgi:RHS repeat-associated protein